MHNDQLWTKNLKKNFFGAKYFKQTNDSQMTESLI